MWSMAVAQTHDKQQTLLITTGRVTARVVGIDGGARVENAGNEICAYDVTSGKLVWMTKGGLPGMATEMCAESVASDGSGHLFICDTNNSCIQVLSADGGSYVAPFLWEGELCMGKPKLVRWCPFSSTMLIAHRVPGQPYRVTILKQGC